MNDPPVHPDLRDLRVAVAHYWMVTWRGGEKVVRAILDLFPRADIYTLFYDRRTCGPYLEGHRVFPSSLDRPLLRSHHQKLFPLYPRGVRSWKLKDRYDLIISSESGPSKGIENPDGVPHLCYVHTPMRYCWEFMDEYLAATPRLLRPWARREFSRLREWDRATADGVDRFVANSRNVAGRISRYYGREADICYPPIARNLFEDPLDPVVREHYLSFGAITPYKNIGLLVDAFNESGKPLVVVGEGSERRKLERRAASNIRFTGPLPDSELRPLVRRSRALLFPGEEDFGMVPLEVMARGVPVIALRAGGALETVVASEDPTRSSGIFFDVPTPEAVAEAIRRFEEMEGDFDPAWIRDHARRFGEDAFRSRFAEIATDFLRQPPRRFGGRSDDEGAAGRRGVRER